MTNEAVCWAFNFALSAIFVAYVWLDIRIRRLRKHIDPGVDSMLQTIGDIEQIRTREGHSVMLVCDDAEAESIDCQAVVDVCGDFTDWEPRRFYGRTWDAALHRAANASRRFNAGEDCL